MKNKTLLIIGIGVVAIALIYFFSKSDKPKAETGAGGSESGGNGDLAKCLKEKGAKFYGASWCPHCRNQKAMFPNPQDLPYIECTGAGQSACQEAGVTGYPTWIFADGQKVFGELKPDQLKKKTGC